VPGIYINTTELAIFFSVLLRLSVIFFMLPIFVTGGFPNNIKVLTILAMSLMLLPFIRESVQPLPLDPAPLTVVIAGEVIFAVIYSLAMAIIIAAFQLAGELVSFEMGFGFSQVADPQSGAEFSVISVWAQLVAMMIFFTMNGHQIVLKLIVESFKTVPVGSFTLDAALFTKVVLMSGLLFVLALKLAAPVMAVLILVQLGLGLMSKFAPQVNILATSWPITIGLGILFLGITSVVWADMAGRSFADLFHFLGNLSR